jgi:predicted amidohydrolase YtcJ
MPPVRLFLGTDRLKGAFGLKTMLDAALRVIAGSDGPGSFTTDPLRDIASPRRAGRSKATPSNRKKRSARYKRCAW